MDIIKRIKRGKYKVADVLIMAYKCHCKMGTSPLTMAIFLELPVEGQKVIMIDWFDRYKKTYVYVDKINKQGIIFCSKV